MYRGYQAAAAKLGRKTPVNVRNKCLKCTIFEYVYKKFALAEEPVDTCRAVFAPTLRADRIWQGSGINAHAHVQICVRNPDCILGTWLVKPREGRDDDQAGRV